MNMDACVCTVGSYAILNKLLSNIFRLQIANFGDDNIVLLQHNMVACGKQI